MSAPKQKPKHHAYAVCYKPVNGCTHDDTDKFIKFAKKTCIYYAMFEHTCREGSKEDGELLPETKHFHCLCVFKNKKTISNVMLDLKRRLPLPDDGSKPEYCYKVSLWYSYAGYVYGTKPKHNQLRECISERMPIVVEDLYKYYSPPPPKEKFKSTINAKYRRWRELYTEQKYDRPATVQSCADFLFANMFKYSSIQIIPNDRKKIESARDLCRYINKAVACDIEFGTVSII